jgi:hypothetical protein
VIVTRDRRERSKEITITMPLDEFRETVEWLEMIDPHDLCTHNWRVELDRVDPQGVIA